MSYFSFKKTEIFQLLNHRPVSAVEIQLLIDNSEERLSEDQVSKVQNKDLPPPKKPVCPSSPTRMFTHVVVVCGNRNDIASRDTIITTLLGSWLCQEEIREFLP